MNKIPAALAALSLTGCSLGGNLLGDGGGDDGGRSVKQRGLNLTQLGLVNVHSGNTYNFPQPPQDRFVLDQRLRISNERPTINAR